MRRVIVLFLALVLAFNLTSIARAQERKSIDVVLILDTSGSLIDQFDVLCASFAPNVETINRRGIDLHATVLAIDKPYACAQGTVKAIKGSTVASDDDWGPAVTDVANNFDWRVGSTRSIIPIVNGGPALGDPVDDPGPDRDAIQRAIKAAQANRVSVSPIIGAPDRTAQPDDRSKLEQLATDLAHATGGKVTQLIPNSDLTQEVIRLIEDAIQSSATGPIFAIPGSVTTLTCQRDSTKCISLDPAVVLTNALLAVLFTVILAFANELLYSSLALLHTRKPGTNAGRLEQAGNKVRNALSAGANKATGGVRTFFAPQTWSIGTPGVRTGVMIVMLVIVVGLAALLASFVDPDFRPNTPRGIGTYLSLFGAIGLVSMLYVRLQLARARSLQLPASVRIRPLSLLVMLIALIVSRSIGFLPGFLIAIPAGLAWIAHPADEPAAQRRIVTAGVFGVLGLAIVIWLLAVPLDLLIGNLLAQPESTVVTTSLNVLGIIQSVVLTIYIVAILLVFSVLLPLRFAAGYHVYMGSRLVWSILFGVVTFITLHTIFNRTASGVDVFGSAPVLVIGALLAVVSAMALALWLSVNDTQADQGSPITKSSLFAVFVLLGAWLGVCACGAISFISRTINWGNVLVVLLVIAILAIGGFIAIRLRAIQTIK